MVAKEVEYIMPQNQLIKKTGTGALAQSILDNAQNTADSLDLDVMPYAISKIKILKTQISSDEFMSAQNDNMIDNFLYDLVPLDVNVKLAKNEGLSFVSSSLLKFVENLLFINFDAYSVIRAHVNALDIVTAKNINTSLSNPAMNALITELQDACNRYNTKYGSKA